MNADGKLMNFLGKLGDMLILNVMYLICCIPIITIGAATTALYYNTLKLAENRESYVWKDFLKAFKENFRQATMIWMFMLTVMAVLAVDIFSLGGLSQALGSLVQIVVIVAGIFLIVMGVYVFPVLSRFDNTIKNTMKNALIMAIRHLPSTIAIMIIHALPLLLGFVSIEVFLRGILIVLLFSASILAYLESKLFTRVFSNYYPKEIKEVYQHG